MDNPQGEVLAAWDDILDINYWAIFAIAKDILEQLPLGDAADILRRLRHTAQSVNATGVDNAHDLTGRIFQTLIADRKYLATFYTLPASAALLARLAVAKMEGVDWSSADAIGRLRIGGLCLRDRRAALGSVRADCSPPRARRGRFGRPPQSDDGRRALRLRRHALRRPHHRLNPLRSGAVLFNSSHLYTMPYGRMRDNSVMIGSLELLKSSNVLTLFNTSDPAMRTGSAGEETAAQIRVEVQDESYDLVIMNPPFTSATNHEGAHADITNPAFAAFNATRADQTAMGENANRLADNTCYHGNAGIASAFAALAHKKIKPGGVLALVLPLSATAGLSWQGFREMISRGYADLTVLTIAAADNDDLSFSSDTGMAECLVIARRLKPDESPHDRARFTSLRHRPHGFAHASSLARRLLGRRPYQASR